MIVLILKKNAFVANLFIISTQTLKYLPVPRYIVMISYYQYKYVLCEFNANIKTIFLITTLFI